MSDRQPELEPCDSPAECNVAQWPDEMCPACYRNYLEWRARKEAKS